MTFSERYALDVPLGESDVGTVWRARATDGGTRVAIIILETDAPESTRARFRDQAAKLVTVRHPNVVRAIEHGDTDEGAPYVALELYEGETLARRLVSGPAPTVGRAVEIAAQIGEGVAVAHTAGIHHGDIEPGNVFLSKSGDAEVPKLIGFALNRADRRASRGEAERLSLPSLGPQWAYAAPEQVRGETVASTAADVYSLAAVLFASLAGQPPHVAREVTGLLEAIGSGKPAALGAIKKELAPFSTVLDRALSSAPEKRPTDMPAFLRSLKTALAFAKAAQALPVPLGARSPIGTPFAVAPKVGTAMPRPGGAVAMGKAPTGAKVVVAKPAVAMADGAKDSVEDGSVELVSIPPPAAPPPPPKSATAGAEGADLGDIAIDSEESASAVSGSAGAGAPADAAPADAAAPARAPADAAPADAAAPAMTPADAAASTTSPGAAATPAASTSTTTSPSEVAREIEAPAATSTDIGEETNAAAETSEHAEAPVAGASQRQPGTATSADRATEKTDEPVRSKPASAWANAEQPAASRPAPKSEATASDADYVAKIAKKLESLPAAVSAAPAVRAAPAVPAAPAVSAVEPLHAAEPLPARWPKWVLPAAGVAALLVAALAFFALGGGGEPTDPAPEPPPSESVAGAAVEPASPTESATATTTPDVDPAAPDPGPIAEVVAEADPAVPAPAVELVPVEPAAAAVVEPPATSPSDATGPRTVVRSTSSSSSGASSGSSGGSTRRTRTPRTTSDRPTVVADPGF